MTPSLGEGSVVAGTYSLGPLIGSGGHGTVHRAHHARTGAPVALKLLGARDPDSLERFLREARLAMGLAHPAIVRVLDAGVAEDGQAYVAYELLEGVSLDKWSALGPFDEARVLAVARPVLQALAEVHAAGIIHRDVKPENLFVCAASPSSVPLALGPIKLLDFGVAKSSVSPALATVPGSILGTPLYMAPEQLTGEPITPATDLYAVGLVLAELLSGRPVFEASLGALVAAKTSEDPVALEPAVRASRLAPVLERALLRRGRERYQTAREMLAALEAVTAPPRPERAGPIAFAATAPAMTLVPGGPDRGPSPAMVATVDEFSDAAAGVDGGHAATVPGPPPPGPREGAPPRAAPATPALAAPACARPVGGPIGERVEEHATGGSDRGLAPSTPLASGAGATRSRGHGAWLVSALLALLLTTAAVIGGVLWQRLRMAGTAGTSRGDEPGAETDEPAQRGPHIPSPVHAVAGSVTSCPIVDQLTWATFRAKLPEWGRTGDVKAGGIERGRQSATLGVRGASFHFYELRGPARVQRAAMAASSMGYQVLTGDKRLVLVDALPNDREAIRKSVCE